MLCVELNADVPSSCWPDIETGLREIAGPLAMRANPTFPAPFGFPLISATTPRLVGNSWRVGSRHKSARLDPFRQEVGDEGAGYRWWWIPGRRICRQLRERGDEVISYNRSRYDELDAIGVEQVQADPPRWSRWWRPVAASTPSSMSAPRPAPGAASAITEPNVRGTANVIAACRMNGIGKLVYTSSPSVTHRSTRPVVGGNEQNVPYGEGFKAWHPATKRIAEEDVLAANDATLATVALRPRLIWGVGELPVVAASGGGAKSGRLRIGRRWLEPHRHHLHRQRRRCSMCWRWMRWHRVRAIAGKGLLHFKRANRSRPAIINSLLRAAGAPTVDKTLGFRTPTGLVRAGRRGARCR